MKKLRLSLLIAATFLSCTVAGNAKAAPATPCTYVAPGTTQQITGPDSVCRQVTNNSATNNLCVMTATTAQWQSFYNNPNGATIATCQCSTGTASWLTNCSASVGVLDYGSSTSTTNTASGYTGSATITCNNGTYSYSATSCSLLDNCAAGNGITSTLTAWNFDASSTAPSIGSATFTLIGGVQQSAFVTGVTAGTTQADGSTNGTASGLSLSTNYYSTGSGEGGFEIATSTSNKTHVVISWDLRRSATGPSSVLVKYSLDGTNFTNASTASLTNTNWYHITADLSAVAGVKNNPNFKFRIVQNVPAGASAGTWRIDNLVVQTQDCSP